jgi:NADPH:quinone reductase-like Zn-dependent oxidoreductase
MSNDTMQAAQIHDYGTVEQIKIERVARPEPKAGEVLVRIKAAGVNPVDWKMRAGDYKQYMPLAFPWIPGVEGAGLVEAVGPNVTTFKPGQAVFGFINKSYAEYAVVPATDLAVKPEQLSFEQAGSATLGAMVAWHAVIDKADVQEGQRILVHGGAGGVGLYAVQFARWKGAHVTTTTSQANADFVRSLGAENVIDYQKNKFEDVVKDMDAVIDTVGGDVIERSLRVLRKGGILVTVAGRVDPEMGKALGVRVASASRADIGTLQQIGKMLESKQIRPQVGKVFPLAQAAEAHKFGQIGHGRGRIILKIEG